MKKFEEVRTDSLTAEQSALYAMQHEPRLIVGTGVIHEDGSKSHHALAVSKIPRKGEIVFNSRKDGDFEVLEVLHVVHWTCELYAGETELSEGQFVDVCLVCKERSLSWVTEQERGAEVADE